MIEETQMATISDYIRRDDDLDECKKNETGVCKMISDGDRLFQFIIKCQKNHNKPDLHSFFIDIDNGRAYVECRSHEVYIKTRKNRIDYDVVKEWCGTAVAATNKLLDMGANYYSIDM